MQVVERREVLGGVLSDGVGYLSGVGERERRVYGQGHLRPIMHDVIWGPMAYAIVGGLAVATMLTLVFLPALYVAVNGIREKDEPIGAPVPDVLTIPMLATQQS